MSATDNSLRNALGFAHGQSGVVSHDWKLLYYLNVYRLAIATLACAVAMSPVEIPPYASMAPQLFTFFSLIYLGVGLFSLEAARWQKPGFENQVTFLAFMDVVILTLLMHMSGGLESGLGLLVMVSIAGSSLLLSRRMTVFYAALATVAVLIEHSWEWLTGQAPRVVDYPQVGILGIGLFAAAALAHGIAQRLRTTQELAQQRGIDLANLAQVNEQIIKSMQSGVLVCDRIGHVRVTNMMARKFIGAQPGANDQPLLTDLSPELAAQLFEWTENPGNRMRKLLRTRTGYTLLPRFMMIGGGPDSGILIFLEDTGILRQQAQQLKMAALARLTASIAHEIRNPLGAISNAAQLLGETASDNGEEQRLVRIIGDQSRRMNVIIENVMQLSRRDHLNPVRFDLDKWLGEFVPGYAEGIRVPLAAFNVVAKPGIGVCMDPDQLYQVVVNLCQNALRHSPPFSGTPVIRLEAGMEDETRPYLDVIDAGSGVAPEIADNIFDPFFTTSPKGTGLGLYIARELCEGNGGRLEYHPGDGVGSRFRITFSRSEECTEFALT